MIDDLNLSMEEPVERDYMFVFGNGEFKVSPLGSHETMADEVGIAPDHTGPMAFGHINVRGRDALWSVESNIGLRGLVKMMKDYSKQVGWEWGGLVDGSGQPVSEEFAGKKSYWYGWREGKLLFSERPFWPHRGRIDVINKVAHFDQALNPFVREGLEEWAEDFGYRIAEYPGGTDMNDRVKNKEWQMEYDKGDPEADPGKAFDGEPQGALTCPYCNETLPDFKAYVLHTTDHQDPKAERIDDGHFPTIEDMDTPLPLRPRNVNPSGIPVMGAWHFPQSMEGAWDEGARWHFEAAGGKEGKDLLQAPIPFIYDIEKDYITVGHPGMRTPEIMGPSGGEELIRGAVPGLPSQGYEGQEIELGRETYVWHDERTAKSLVSARMAGERLTSLPMENGLYYRAHKADAPWGSEYAESTPLEPGLEHYGRPGYSAFWNPHHLREYMNEQRWNPENEGRWVVAFRGTPIGGGVDGEPRVRPSSPTPEFALPWSEFEDRLENTENGYGKWYEHTWGDGPEGKIVDDGYRTLKDLG